MINLLTKYNENIFANYKNNSGIIHLNDIIIYSIIRVFFEFDFNCDCNRVFPRKFGKCTMLAFEQYRVRCDKSNRYHKTD